MVDKVKYVCYLCAMYIRKVTHRNKKNHQEYFTFKLVESSGQSKVPDSRNSSTWELILTFK